MRVLVTGGTGTLGRELVPRLAARGAEVRVLSRRDRAPGAVAGDLVTGAGLAEAVRDVDTVVHAASAFTAAEATDVTGTRRLLDAARAASVPHLVYVSVVGVEKVPMPYYRAKLAAEAAVRAGGVPWSILRATQFHTLIEDLLRRLGRVPGLLAVPRGALFQPVHAADVAARLAEVALAPPAGRLPDLGGPEVRELADLGHAWVTARDLRKWVVGLPVPSRAARAVAAGALCAPDHADGRITWEQYLETRAR
jgi:uncharacterized protein YbjT (DUF2867 family)